MSAIVEIRLRPAAISRCSARWISLVLLLLLSTAVSTARAQTAVASGGVGEVWAGGELEEYLRYLQTLGDTELYPWSIRAFSLKEVDRLAPRNGEHPWAGRYSIQRDSGSASGFRSLPVSVRTVFNSAFPYGNNDGPVWAGRGVTGSAQTGFQAWWGDITVTVAPMVFWSQNSEFELRPPADPGTPPYSDPFNPSHIDLPQRFGGGSYSRIDPGQSTLRVDELGFTAGISTANETWGPGSSFPLLLGNNAPGFLHGFLGTSTPWNVGVGRIHGRLVWGRLDQSNESEVPRDSATRFMSGIVGTFTPRGITGLEIGAARFFHTPWPNGGLRPVHLLKPFETFAKLDIDSQGREVWSAIATNQLASLFFRWALPRSGLEVYGEFAREDNSHNLRDFTLEPDHNSGYMVGMRKAWKLNDSRIVGVRGEVVNATQSHLNRARRQEPFYVHGVTRQGHTERGQTLGSPAAYYGAGSVLGVDLYEPSGRLSVEWTRVYHQGAVVPPGAGESVDPGNEPMDVEHALGASLVAFRGRFDWSAGLTGVYEFDRTPGHDSFNLRALVGMRARL